jgi:hypothetical protein
VVFVERGRGAGRVIGSADHGGRGKFSFRADGARGRRRVDAIVEQAGIPRRRVAVAAFSGPKPARPALPGRPVVARDGSGLRIAWRGARRADRYALRLALPDARRLLFLTDGGDRTVRVPRVPRRGRAVVRVVGLTRANRAGPGAQTSYELAGRRHDR